MLRGVWRMVPLLVYSGRNLKLNNDLWATVPKTHLINQSAINSWEPRFLTQPTAPLQSYLPVHMTCSTF